MENFKQRQPLANDRAGGWSMKERRKESARRKANPAAPPDDDSASAEEQDETGTPGGAQGQTPPA